MEGLIGREWVKFPDVVAILSNFSEEEFFGFQPGPYLLEIPLEQEPGQASEAATDAIDGLYRSATTERSPTARSKSETQRIARPLRPDDLEDPGTKTMSVDDLMRRKRKKADPRILFLGSHARTTFGRGTECDVRVFGNAVSRLHASIERSASGKWVIMDLGSRNGTAVNGRRLTPQLPVTLADEQVVQLGDWRCAVMFPRRLWELAEKLRVAL